MATTNNILLSGTVHRGPWINWSHGLIAGTTVTLDERSGGLLTAFIATFITVVGAELWKIICYVLHQVRSQPTPQDGLYHQQQIILKNSPTPGGAAWLWFLQMWTWAGKARVSFARTFPWALFGICYIVAVGVMAIFSSEISKSPGPQRLLNSDNCGTWALNMSSPFVQNALQSKLTNDSLAAATYAKSCYSNDLATANPQCQRYPVPNIEWTSEKNASCPFQSGVCIWNDKSAFSMTSKMIDSHIDLGINSPHMNRVQFEKSTTCAPIHAKPFATRVNVTADSDYPGMVGDIMYYFWYGPLGGDDATSNTSDYTTFYNTHATMDSFGYSLQAYNALAGYPPGLGVFEPIPEINTTHSDLSLLFIAANSIRFAEPCDDPVFAAHYLVNSTSVPFWQADQYVNVVACSESYRVCNPNNGVCTPQLGRYQLGNAFLANEDGLQLTSKQNATAFRIVLASVYSSVYHATMSRGGNSLRASELVSQLSQAALPNNQWQIEASSWFDTGLARLQAGIQEYVTNPSNIVPGSKLNRFSGSRADPWVQMCYDQLVNDSSNSMSFSVLGLAILFILGGAIIILSFTLDTVVGFIQRRTGKGLHARMEWIVNDKLQMQRMLHRELRLGEWNVDADTKIPSTAGYEKQLFYGPAEKALAAEGFLTNNSSDEGVGVHLVQEEHYQGNGEKGLRDIS